MQRTSSERTVRPVPALRVVAGKERSGWFEEAMVRVCTGNEAELEGGTAATTAPSCLLRPRPGDRVLLWRSGAGRVVVAVLERDGGGATVVSSDAGLVLEAPHVSVRGERVDLRAGELLTSARAVHEVSRISTRSAELRVAEIGTDIRRAKTARDEVEGTFVQRLGTWVSDTAREARIAARTMLFS